MRAQEKPIHIATGKQWIAPARRKLRQEYEEEIFGAGHIERRRNPSRPNRAERTMVALHDERVSRVLLANAGATGACDRQYRRVSGGRLCRPAYSNPRSRQFRRIGSGIERRCGT